MKKEAKAAEVEVKMTRFQAQIAKKEESKRDVHEEQPKVKGKRGRKPKKTTLLTEEPVQQEEKVVKIQEPEE